MVHDQRPRGAVFLTGMRPARIGGGNVGGLGPACSDDATAMVAGGVRFIVRCAASAA